MQYARALTPPGPLQMRAFHISPATAPGLVFASKRSRTNSTINRKIPLPCIPDRRCPRLDRRSAPLPQMQALTAASCARIPEHQASGGKRATPRPTVARNRRRAIKGADADIILQAPCPATAA